MNASAIPESMRERHQWIGWRYETREGKRTKVPIDVHTGRLAATDNPKTWATFDEVMFRVSRQPGLAGAGYVFAVDDPFTGIDLDNCLTAGAIKAWAAPFIALLDSYTEITPSGNGLHVILRGRMEGDRHKTALEDGAVEVYDHLRFFTVTGERWNGSAVEPLHRQEQLTRFCREVMPPKEKPTNGAHPTAPVSLDDRALLEKMFAAKNGSRVRSLWQGDTSDYAGDDSSADLALLDSLAFWTGRDPSRMDSMFRQSGLYRPKWDRQDYRERTIAKAIAGCTESYAPLQRTTVKATENGKRAAEQTGAPDRPPIYTLPELMLKKFQPIQWLVPDVLRSGLILFGGREKSGKSVFATQFALALATGGKILNRDVPRRPVLYLCLEDAEQDLQERFLMQLAGCPPPPNLHYATYWPRLDQGVGSMPWMKEWALAQGGEAAIIIDTLKRIRSRTNTARGIYDSDYEGMEPFLNLAREVPGLAVAPIHHCGKSQAEDAFDRFSGSTGLSAPVDGLMVFTDSQKGRAVLSIKGRRGTPWRAYGLELDKRTETWNCVSEGEDRGEVNTRTQILEVLNPIGGARLTPKEVAEECGFVDEKGRALVRVTLRRMEAKGEVLELASGYTRSGR